MARASRAEFGKPVKRAAMHRSGGLCEAVGTVYGLEPGKRCNSPLSHGVEFDHYPVRAADGGEATLENCAAVCPTCHRFKTTKFDTPMAAKGKRISDKHQGIRPMPSMRSAGFAKRPKQHSATRPLIRKSERHEA